MTLLLSRQEQLSGSKEMVIDGIELSKEIRSKLKEDITSLKETYNEVPHLVVLLIGNDPASESYVKAKERACKQVGIKSTLIKYEDTITEQFLLDEITKLNNDQSVHGILVQLPLPAHISQDSVIDHMSQIKDVEHLNVVSTSFLTRWPKAPYWLTIVFARYL